MDNGENTPKPRYINEYRKIGDILGSKPNKDKSPLDKLLLQVFISLIIIALVLLVNSINLKITKAVTQGIKKTLNWQMDFGKMEQVLKDFNSPKEKENENNINKEEVLDTNSSIFIMPLKGEVTSLFGERIHPVFNTVKDHNGIDIDGNYGDKIKASMEGKVSKVGEDSTLGKYIKIENGIYGTLYAHCSKVIVKEGQDVKQNDIIAEVGDTGLASGSHLHFEIWVDGKPVNPLEKIK